MAIKNKFTKRIIAILLAMTIFLATLPSVGLMSSAAAGDYYNRVADVSTMDNWKNYFSLTDISTENAGGVWTDKSVFTNSSAFDGMISMKDGDKNFLTALSAIAANKEIVGYSAVPTDTIFVLDLSTSMASDDVSRLVSATNDAIKKLQGENENNRVGVVLYSGNTDYDDSVSRLLPLDRYTTTRNDGNFINYSRNTVSVYSGVAGTKPLVSESRTTGTYTYIQAGLWEAYQMFEEVPDNDIMIGDNNWQSGDYRMPILVLMTDGAPTNGTNAFDNVGDGNFGSNFPYGLKSGDAFFVQLTAAYVKNRIENKYKVHEEYGAGRSLFYTLGFNISPGGNANQENDDNIAYSVVNPEGTTITDSYWNTYNTRGSVQVTVTGSRQNSTKTLTATKNSYATSKNYVDEYFSASGSGLTAVFDNVVEEILIQSRYYPTHLEGGSPDFAGYVEFTDTIGEYMEIKDVKGILLGDTLFDGHMMASKISDSAEGGLGTVENPTALGNEFMRAVKTRLGISDNAEAQALVAKAVAAGQLYYNSATDWSNYIGWYAKADGTYAGFYDEGNTVAPADAVYVNRSYGFLGETSGSIKNSDMMYMSVQIHESIETGQQTLIWKIPASLVPLVTYAVTLEGTNVDHARNVRVEIENADEISPIRLVYESGLRSDLNELNITRITDSEHIAADGVTRVFWNNYFDISAAEHEDHVTTMSEFTPSKENERFYYTFDSAVLKKDGEGYVVVGQNEGANGALDQNAEYYHRRYIFTEDSTTPVFTFEKMSKKSIAAAKWDADYTTLDGSVGAWVVPKGTPARELSMYSADKDNNLTNSAHMIFYPYLTEQNNTFYVDMNLGNNGLLSVTPAQGIKITKTIDVYEEGTSDEFSFRITAKEANGTAVSGRFEAYYSAAGEVPFGEAEAVTFRNGELEIDLAAGQSFWIVGLSAGSTYEVEEISDNEDYKLKSVHVNGTATGATAVGAVAAYLIDDVSFVNTAVGEGDLVITKQVLDQNGKEVQINDEVKFTATVTLTSAAGAPVSGIFQTGGGSITVPASGKFTVTLGAGESFIMRELVEGTRYTVEETNIPEGFTLDTAKSVLSGEVDATANDQALIVNTYKPIATNGNGINVTVNKVISGNRTNWVAGESYTFVLEQGGKTVGTKTISATDVSKSALFSLAPATFAEAGNYNYRIYEQKGNQGGITYDSTDRRFSVTVADADMDGKLEVTSVTNLAGTTVSGKYNVAATFTNLYAPSGSAEVTLSITKRMNGNHRLDGYRFALYDANPKTSSEANEIVRSTATNSAGVAHVSLAYTAESATISGTEFKYWLAEIIGSDPNVSYDTKVYPVTVTVYDNADGTLSAELMVEDLPTGEVNPVFTNTYVPSASDFVTISGTKEISGDRVLNSGEFSFKISADTVGAPLPASTTVRNNADGSFAFGAIEFTDAHKGNDYIYTVSEVSSNKIGGFTYDSASYKVYVSVKDNGDATLTATVTKIEKVNGTVTAVSDIKFVNVYDAEDAVVTLGGTKLLTGKTLQDGEFTFKLTANTAGAPMPAFATVKNDANGAFTFGNITFNKAGTYLYSLAEVQNGDTRYTFDKSVYTVTVTVTDNSQGRLYATVKLAKNDMTSTEIVFRNGFVPTAISFDIYEEFGGDKLLEGRPIKAEEFEFVLINAVNGAQIGSSVRNDENGKFRFPEVSLAEAGIHHFKITEVVGDEACVSYDTSSFHLRLEVVQNADGSLEIADKKLYKGTVTKEEVDGVLTEVTSYNQVTSGGILFRNLYETEPTGIIIKAEKEFRNGKLTDGLFSFELYDAEGNLLETAENDGSKIEFSEIEATVSGSYVYTVKEKAGDLENVTYDDTVYTVTAVVTDNLDGTLSVSYNYATEKGEAEEITFVNLYEEPETTPETGDGSKVGLWIALFFVSGGTLVGAGIYKKRKSN